MKNRYLIPASSLLMIFMGLLRGSGGIALLQGGAQLDTKVPIIASEGQLNTVGIGLLIAGVLLIVAAVYYWGKHTRRSWFFGWIALAFFLLNGLINGFILFGQPLVQGQIIYRGSASIIGILLYLSRPHPKSV